MKTETESTDGQPTIQDVQVVAWRRRQLLAAGFSLALADELARDCSLDLHALTALVAHGCSPRLAARILAPLDEEPRRC